VLNKIKVDSNIVVELYSMYPEIRVDQVHPEEGSEALGYSFCLRIVIK